MPEKKVFKDYETIVAQTDNFNREEFVNMTWIQNKELIIQQKDAVVNNTLTFNIPKSAANHALDLTTMRMGISLRVVGADGGLPAPGDVVAPINYFCQTMIQKVVIYFNDLEVSSTGAYYAQRALFDAYLNHDRDDRDSYLYTQGFLADQPDGMENAGWDRAPFYGRALFFGEPNAAGTAVTYTEGDRMFYVPILSDICKVDLPLISDVNVRVVIHFHDPHYSVWTDNTPATIQRKFKLDVTAAELRIKLLQAAEGYGRSIEDILKEGPIKYRFKRVEVKPHTIPANSSIMELSGITQSSVNPERIMIIMQRESLVNAGYVQNPLNFRADFPAVGYEPDTGQPLATLSKANVMVNGDNVVKSSANNQDSFARLHFNEMNEKMGTTSYGNGFEFRHFQGGNYVQIYDLTKSGRAGIAGNVRQVTKDGNVHVSIHFNNPLRDPVQVLIFQEFNASVSIDSNRNVLFQYLD